ncbi:MAG: hypothetical protein WB952_07895 [Terriglobales bacterium]
MFNANSAVRKTTLLSAAVLILSLAATAMDFDKGKTLALCDSFGKTWSATVASCNPSLPLSLCLSGARDTLNLNACGGGAQAMFGESIGARYLFTAYTVESSGCSSTFWAGDSTSSPTGKITGNVYNSGGKFGSFTIVPGACGASVHPNASSDPAFVK